MTSYEFSRDPARLDVDRVHTWLSEHAYWALGRSREVQETAIAGSQSYGMYETATGRQVAYARVVTDGATFAWLCDVIVDPAVRGLGLGVRLVEGVVADLGQVGIERTLLKTGDAHGLYERFGFDVLEDPELWMIRFGG